MNTETQAMAQFGKVENGGMKMSPPPSPAPKIVMESVVPSGGTTSTWMR